MMETCTLDYFMHETGLTRSQSYHIIKKGGALLAKNCCDRMKCDELSDKIIKGFEPQSPDEKTRKELAEHFDVTLNFINKLVRSDGFPKPRQIIRKDRMSRKLEVWRFEDVGHLITSIDCKKQGKAFDKKAMMFFLFNSGQSGKIADLDLIKKTNELLVKAL